ncbi:spermidine synthase [Streptomyces sp. SPB074]|uniref:spermidine synthase n=1 Tax=Streptomyces sp. (strain SPB074) TaxID=465543 RepID=UPI0001D1DD1E|nr:fused MFS/spermidine synthase [Streptomyces sp. SPB074]EFG65627.1 spermidine synthase [Streptomyces sp. SPB074]
MTSPEPLPVRRSVDHGVARLLPDVDRARAWLLTVDEAPQSYVDLDAPAHLEFEYTRRMGHALDLLAGESAPLDAAHLGGGALTLPRYLAATRPGSRQHVVEADRGLAALVDEVLPPVPGAAVHVEDARAWLEGAPDDSADVLVADVFGGSSVPGHLTTTEYAREAARVLRPGGLYLANLADSAPFAFLGTQLATLGTAFAHLALLAEPAVLRGRRFGNVVVLASTAPLRTEGLARRCARDAFPARLVTEHADIEALRGTARPVRDGGSIPSPLPPGGTFRVG